MVLLGLIKTPYVIIYLRIVVIIRLCSQMRVVIVLIWRFSTKARLSNDTDAEVRSQCAETLALIPCEESESILVSLLDDADNLVRANACDSLKFSHSKLIVKKLIFMLSDTSYLVRGYATLTIADILANISEGQFSGEVVQLFKNNEATEQSDWVKIAIYRSLVMLGENEYFIPFLNMLHSSDYRNRIFVLNIIDDIPNHKKEILNHLMKQQREEVISHIKQKIQEKLEVFH